MAFKLVVSDTVTVPVKGHIPNAAGSSQPFAFSLVCRRLKGATLRTLVKDPEQEVAPFITEVTTGWQGVLGEDDQPLPFTDEALSELLDIVGMPGLVFAAYIDACGAKGKEKN